MTQTEKAERFESLTRESDVIQREISKLQSANAGINTTSEEYDNKLNHLRHRLSILEQEMVKLFI